MSKILKNRIKKIGLSPGTLVHIGDYIHTKIKISVIDYNATTLVEKNDVTLDQCLEYLDTPLKTWINIRGIHDVSMIQKIGAHFGLHPLMLEDIVNSDQRSKLDDYKENIFIVMRMLSYDHAKSEIVDEQISIVLGKRYVISFVESDNNIFLPILQRLRKENSRTRQMDCDYLCYSLMDCVVDNYFIILEQVDHNLEKLEEELTQDAYPSTLMKIQKTKRDVILLRKSIWPTREVMSQFRRLETSLMHESTRLYTQDVYDHTIQAIDTIESFRDITSGMLDVYLSNMSHKMNEIIKVLTVVATIFAPLTFITGLYGMNFEHMPELQSPYGYPIALVSMLLISLIMLYYFRRKKWI